MKLDRVWKFGIELLDRQQIIIPANFSVLSVGLDPAGDLCMWAAVDKDAETRTLEIIVVGTGEPMPPVGTFLGTVTQGLFVWHIFAGPGHDLVSANFNYQTAGNAP